MQFLYVLAQRTSYNQKINKTLFVMFHVTLSGVLFLL